MRPTGDDAGPDTAPRRSAARRDSDTRFFWITSLAFLLLLTLWRLWVAAVVPVVQDEAYYFLWSRDLAWGYFDHPPMVAVLAATARFAGGSPLVARLGNLLSGCAVCLFTASFVRKVGFRDWRLSLSAVVLGLCNLAVLVEGVVITPDAPLCLGWIIAMHETLAALKGAGWRWLGAGFGAGLAMLGKYTAVLFFPIALFAIIKTRPGALRTPWPFLGALVTTCMFLPNVAWNAHHEWLTMRYQLTHGLGQVQPGAAMILLPQPMRPAEDGPESRLAAFFSREKEEATPVRDVGRIERSLRRVAGYWAAQLGLWGALAAVVVLPVWRWVRRRPKPFEGWSRHVGPEARPLVLAAGLVPLIFFALVSIGAKVEANWPITWVLGGAVWLASLVGRRWRLVLTTALVNVLLVSLVAAHAARPTLVVGGDRALAETHGFRELAGVVSGLDGPVSAESYQLVSMLHFYSGRDLFQWPGILRDSELTRAGQTVAPAPAWGDLIREGHFWLVTGAAAPPAFPAFSASRLIEIRDCGAPGVQVTEARSPGRFEPRCERAVHVWYATEYALADKGTPIR